LALQQSREKNGGMEFPLEYGLGVAAGPYMVFYRGWFPDIRALSMSLAHV